MLSVSLSEVSLKVEVGDYKSGCGSQLNMPLTTWLLMLLNTWDPKDGEPSVAWVRCLWKWKWSCYKLGLRSLAVVELPAPERWWAGSAMTLNYGGLVVTVVKLPGHQHCPRLRVVKLGAWPERWMLRLTPCVGHTEDWLNYADNHVRNDIKLASGSLRRQSSETVLRRWSEGWLNYACNHIQIWVFRQHCSACLCLAGALCWHLLFWCLIGSPVRVSEAQFIAWMTGSLFVSFVGWLSCQCGSGKLLITISGALSGYVWPGLALYILL